MTTKITPIKTTSLKNTVKKEVESITPTTALTKILDKLSPCKHLHLVPLEISFIRITHPNGYKEQPKCEFYVGISLATALRVRKYFCPECNEIVKAPSIYAEEK